MGLIGLVLVKDTITLTVVPAQLQNEGILISEGGEIVDKFVKQNDVQSIILDVLCDVFCPINFQSSSGVSGSDNYIPWTQIPLVIFYVLHQRVHS